MCSSDLKMEAMGKSGDVDSVPACFAEFQEHFHKVVHVLTEFAQGRIDPKLILPMA